MIILASLDFFSAPHSSDPTFHQVLKPLESPAALDTRAILAGSFVHESWKTWKSNHVKPLNLHCYFNILYIDSNGYITFNRSLPRIIMGQRGWHVHDFG